MDIFNLAAKLSLDKTEYDKALDEGESKAKKFGDSLKTGLKTAAGIGAAAVGAVATGVAALGAKFVSGVKDLGAYGDAIDKNSQKMGISAQAYQEWAHVLDANGASIDSLQASMLKMAKAAEDGSGAFEALGISADELNKLTQEDLFARVIEGLQGMEEGSTRTALASELLGRASTELGPLLNQTAADTAALKQEAHDLGYVLGDDVVKNSAAFSDALDRVTKVFSSFKKSAVEQFLPAVTTILDGIKDLGTGDTEKGFDEISKGVDALVEKLAESAPKVLELGGKLLGNLIQAIGDNLPKLMEQGGQVVENLIKGVLSEGSLTKLVQTGLDTVKKLAEGIDAKKVEEFAKAAVQLVLDLAETIANSDLITNLIDAGIAIVVGLANAMLDPETITALLERAPDIIEKLVMSLVEGTEKLVDAAIAILDKLIDGLDDPETWEKFLEAAGKILETLAKAITRLTVKAGEAGQKLIEMILDGAEKSFGKIGEFAGKLVDEMGAAIVGRDNWDKFKEWGKSLIGRFVDGIKEKWNELKDTVMSIIDPFGWLQDGWDAIKGAWNSAGDGIESAINSWTGKTESAANPIGDRMSGGINVTLNARAETPAELFNEWTAEVQRSSYLKGVGGVAAY